MRLLVVLLSALFGLALLLLVRRVRRGPARRAEPPVPRGVTFLLPARFPAPAPEAVYPVADSHLLPGRELLLAICERLKGKGWRQKRLEPSGYDWSTRLEHGRFGGDLSVALEGAGEGVSVAAAGARWTVHFWDHQRVRPAPGLLLTDVASALDQLGASEVQWVREGN